MHEDGTHATIAEIAAALRGSYLAADAAGAGYRRGDPGWTAAGADDAGGADATASGTLVCAEIGTSAFRLTAMASSE